MNNLNLKLTKVKTTINMIKNEISSMQKLTERSSSNMISSSSINNISHSHYKTPSLSIQHRKHIVQHYPPSARELSRTLTNDKYMSSTYYTKNNYPTNLSINHSSLVTLHNNSTQDVERSQNLKGFYNMDKYYTMNKNLINFTRNKYCCKRECRKKGSSCFISNVNNYNYKQYETPIKINHEIQTPYYFPSSGNYSMRNYTAYNPTKNILTKEKDNHKSDDSFEDNKNYYNQRNFSEENERNFNIDTVKKSAFLNYIVDSNTTKTKQHTKLINYDKLLQEIRILYNNSFSLKDKLIKSLQKSQNTVKYNKKLFEIYKSNYNHFANKLNHDYYLDMCKWMNNSKNKIIYYRREIDLYKELFEKLLTICNVNDLNEMGDFAQKQFEFISCGNNVKRTVMKMITNNYLNNEMTESVSSEMF